MALPPHAVEWMSRAEIDYIGPFVKAWAAFNAWYRNASGAATERQMLNFVIHNPNSGVRRHALPLLDNQNVTAEAEGMKQAICDLHLRLDAIQFEVTRKGFRERVSLREVCLSPKPLQREAIERSRHRFMAEKIQGGQIEVTVTSIRSNSQKFRHAQDRYDPADVYAHQDFGGCLSPAQQNTLRMFYDGCNPRPMSDLVHGNGPQLTASTVHFRCTPEEMLAGLIEVIYAMRNALLHGEVDPDPAVLACYEPAYRIVMGFLAPLR